jgi:hypothetical protein
MLSKRRPIRQAQAMRLGPTYYDDLKKRDPVLLEYVRRELANIREKRLQGPFGLIENFQVHFDSYLSDLAKRFAVQARNQLGFVPSDLTRSDEFIRIASAREIDYLTVTNFELFGRKTFFIASNLVEHLALTQLNAPSEFVRPPFDCSMFVYRSRLAVQSLYRISKRVPPDHNAPISVFIIQLPAEEGERKLVFACFHGNLERTYFYVNRQLLIRDDWTIERMLRTDWSDIYKESEDESELVDESVFYNEGMLFFRILINSLLYLSSNDVDTIDCLSPHAELIRKLNNERLHREHRQLKKQLQAVSSLNYSLIGSKVGHIIVRKPQLLSGTPEENVPQRKLAVRFVVRGHWRHQPFGERRKERHLTWIRPYYKGPEMAELISKPYVVK